MVLLNKEVFVKKESYSGTLAPNAIAILDYRVEAEKSDYLPHNKLRLFNTDSVTLWVFLNEFGDGLKPDYILGAGTGIDESVLEGVSFNTIIIQNKDSTVTTTANTIKSRVATVREVNI